MPRDAAQAWDAILALDFGTVDEIFAHAQKAGLIPTEGESTYDFTAGTAHTTAKVNAAVAPWRMVEAGDGKGVIQVDIVAGSLSYGARSIDLSGTGFTVTVPIGVLEERFANRPCAGCGADVHSWALPFFGNGSSYLRDSRDVLFFPVNGSTPMALLAHSVAHVPVLSDSVKGIALKVASAFVFTLMVTIVKVLSDRLPIGEILFARNFFAILPVFAMVAWRGDWNVAFRTQRPFGHIGRGLIGVAAMFLWFGSLSVLPLHDATAISYAAPLITVALAAVLLRETVRFYRWSAVLVGFGGILLVLSPHIGRGGVEGPVMWGAAACLASAGFMALAMITIRSLARTERTTTTVVYFTVISTLLSLVTIPFGWSLPTAEEAGLLLLIGLLGGFGQLLMTQAYRYAEASTIAPFDYTTMIWVLIFGVLFFSEIPTLEVVLGSAIIVGAGLFVLLREQSLGIDRTKARRASTPSKA